MITDENQQVVWAADYEPFGRADVQEDGIAHFSRFPGQHQDPETGLYYNYFRDDDAGIGRYIESDPIGLFGGHATFTYALSNPAGWEDFYGLSPRDVERIIRIYEEVTQQMTDNGERTSPKLNNLMRNITRFPGRSFVEYDPSKFGHYLYCHEQAIKVLNALKGVPDFDDNWEFLTVDNDIGDNYSHTWGRASSNNPSDPTIYLDPFYNRHGESSCECENRFICHQCQP